MANTFASTLATLSPDHSWPMGEASGDYLDEVGSFDLAENLASQLWRQAPGVIRNAPFEFGVWGAQEADDRFIIGPLGDVPVSSGWTTGVLNCFIMQFDAQDNGTIPFTPFSVGLSSGTAAASSIRIEINNSGGVRVIVGSATGGDRIFSDTVNGLITFGVPYMLTLIQRGDSTGLHVLINGVDVTNNTTIGGAATLNSFGDLFTGGVASHITVNGQQTNGFGGARAIVQRPAIWRNTVITDAQVAALHNSANLEGVAADYYEYCLENFVVPGNTKWWWPGWIAPSGTNPVDAGTNGRGAAGTDMGFPSLDTLNILETDRITAYNNYKSLFGGSTNASLTVPELSGFSTGTVNLLLTFQEVSTTAERFVFGVGPFTTTIGKMAVCFQGTFLGYNFTVTLGEVNTGNVLGTNGIQFTVLPADGGIPLAGFVGDLFTMFTIVQDGAKIALYRDGQVITDIAENINGAGWDDSSWWDDIPTAGDTLAIGFPGSASSNNFVGNDFNDMLLLPGVALDADEVLALWNATQGIFASIVGPPDGGFFDTLNETGNALTVNGPGPTHWWRMNVDAAPLDDIGLNNNPVPDGASILTGGDPTFEVTGPLITDPTNEAIYFDGQGDYFEIGADLISGELEDSAIGTIGFFVSRNDVLAMIAYSQANDLATAFFRIGINTLGQLELKVQTSAGNSVTFTSSLAIADLDFYFMVITNDGGDYIAYFNGAVDPAAAVVVEGTGAAGDWFDSFTATRNAIGALAGASFPTDTNGRFSEIFIYDEVLDASIINALFESAIDDGFGSSATAVGVLVFEDVTFLNGARADIRLSNSLTTFNQVLQVNRSRFIGGLESVDAESISLTGEARASLRGCTFDLDVDPTTGRAAVLATTADPTAGATTYGNLLVSDCTFNRMGHSDTEVHPAVFAESGFGMTVEKSRFIDTFAAAIGWRADARRLLVAHNLIDTVSAGVAAIYCQTGLNTNIGNGWNIRKNTVLDVALGNGITIFGANSSAAEFARDVQVVGNNVQTVGAQAIAITQVSDLLEYGNRIGGSVVEGIRLGNIAGVVQILRNFIEGNSAEGIVLDEATTQIATLIIDRNTVNASLSGDGILVDGIDELVLTNNKLLNLINGLTLGEIGSSAKLFGNQFDAVAVPLAFVAATTQNGLEIGQNQNDGELTPLTVAAEAISVFAQDHTITLGSAADLATINGFETVVGYTMVLRLAVGSSDVTVVDTGNINLDAAADFIMDTAGESQIWLVSDGAGSWNELSRALGS